MQPCSLANTHVPACSPTLLSRTGTRLFNLVGRILVHGATTSGSLAVPRSGAAANHEVSLVFLARGRYHASVMVCDDAAGACPPSAVNGDDGSSGTVDGGARDASGPGVVLLQTVTFDVSD